MFGIGDKVVYPMHGAGVIESIEEREVLGEFHKYYVLNIPVGNMKVYIPVNNVDRLGIRGVITDSEVQGVLKVLEGKGNLSTLAWNRRYRANMDRIKSGDIYAVAEVVRSLSQREREKGLSTGEKKMYENACQILESELVLAAEGHEDEMKRQLDQLLA